MPIANATKDLTNAQPAVVERTPPVSFFSFRVRAELRACGAFLVPVLCGGVLVAAGFLKATQTRVAGVIGPETWPGAALIQMEILVGFALLLRLLLPWSSWAAVLLYGCFALFSCQQAFSGAKSCGCFGDVATVRPVVMVALDSVAVASLLWWQLGLQGPRVRDLRRSVVILAPWLSVFPFLVWSGGYPGLRLEDPIVELGKVRRGQSRDVVFRVRNPNAQPVTIARWVSSCPCLTAERAPVTPWEVLPGQVADLTFTFDTTKEPDFVGLLQLGMSGVTPGGNIALSGSVRAEVARQ